MEKTREPAGAKAAGTANLTGRTSSAGVGMLYSYRREIKIIGAVLIILVVAFIALYLYVNSQVAIIVHKYSAPKISGIPEGAIGVLSQGVLSYNYSNYLVEYARVHYIQSNAVVANLSLTLYSTPPVQRIYLVNAESYCVQCFLGQTLLGALNASLAKYGLIQNGSSLNYVDINQLSTVPPGSTVIIASGLIPNILLTNITYTERCSKSSNATMVSMLSQGDTVVYVGRNFSRSVSCSGQIAQDSLQETGFLSTLSNSTIPNFTRGTLHLANPTFFLIPGNNFGSASGTSVLNGSLVVLSNYPYAGWNNSAPLLASDIAEVLASRFWLNVLSQGNATLPLSPHGNTTLFTLKTMIPYSPGVSREVNASYALLSLKLYNGNNSQYYELPLRYTLRQNGLVSFPPVVPQTSQTQFSAQVFNESGSVVIGQVPVYDSNFSLAQNPIPIGQIGPTALYKPWVFSIPSGYYIAELRDQHDTQYASALFLVSNATISPVDLDYKNGSFLFYVSSDGSPISGVSYTIDVNGAYNSTGILQDGSIKYTLPKSTVLSYGTGFFYLSILGSNYAVPYNYQYNGPTVPPLYIAFGVAALFIIILNRILVPINVEEYFIDVPDVKPPKHERATETPESIVSVFQSVNTLYHWTHMPLTPEEVKSGIAGNIKYGNARMTVTLRNTNAILNTLVRKGVLAMSKNYYAPAKWLEESGHDIEYLVMYRRLRDYCIANAMLITEPDGSDKADVVITRKGAQDYVKIYSSSVRIKDMEIGQRVKTFLLFLDEDKMLSFMEVLYKSYGPNAEILKMAINYGNVKLVHSDDLGALKS